MTSCTVGDTRRNQPEEPLIHEYGDPGHTGKQDMAFHIIVCIKSVITRAPANGTLRSVDTAVLNPFDRIALERALTLSAERKGTVTALSMGPESCSFALFEAIAMGAHRGILLSDPRCADSDTLATSTALAGAIGKLAPYDLILFGTRTSDSDTGQVGPQTAVSLEIPLVTGVTSLEWKKKVLRVERRIDEFREIFELSPPAAFTIHPAAVKPRDIPLGGIEDAFTCEEVGLLTLDDLSLDPAKVGTTGSPTRVVSMKKVSRERKCEFIEGTVEDQADVVVTRLKESGLLG